jgi:hypothetical protein
VCGPPAGPLAFGSRPTPLCSGPGRPAGAAPDLGAYELVP